MSNKDVIIKDIPVILGTPRLLRLTWRSLYMLEARYGTIQAALEALTPGKEPVEFIRTIEFFTAVTLRGKPIGKRTFNKVNLAYILTALKDLITAHLPDIDENAETEAEPEKDWDNLYFIGRYRLKMSDDEFWNCPPRRFYKLHELWLREMGLLANPLESSARHRRKLDAAGL